jgi:transcriptional regulator with XRE-family HTH domain
MSLKRWEKRVLKAPGATARVAEMEDELRLAAGLTALRERAGFSQRELALRMGVSQPRVAAIERAQNVTIDVLGQYAFAIGGQLEVAVAKGGRKIPVMVSHASGASHYAAKKKAATTGAGRRAPTGKRRRGT